MTENTHSTFRPIRETIRVRGEIVPINAELVLDYLRYRGAKKAIETDSTSESEETLSVYRNNLLIEMATIPKLSGKNPKEIFDEVASELERISIDFLK